jgi:RNA polymerase sigma-70 factor (ECF subfamily)
MNGATFQDIYDAYSADVWRFSRYLTGSDEEADEITSETFVRAWTASAPVRAATAKSYLLAIARNLAMDARRRRKRFEPASEAMVSGASNPEQQLELRQVLDAVRELPEQLSEPLLMHAAGGLSYEEIAQVLAAPLSTVKIRIYRARLRLSERLGMLEEKK